MLLGPKFIVVTDTRKIKKNGEKGLSTFGSLVKTKQKQKTHKKNYLNIYTKATFQSTASGFPESLSKKRKSGHFLEGIIKSLLKNITITYQQQVQIRNRNWFSRVLSKII